MDFTLNNSLRASLNWLFPDYCLLCWQPINSDQHPCCADCYDHLPFQTQACQRCGRGLPGNLDYCGHCLHDPPNFDTCFSPFLYETPIIEWIQQYKYAQRPDKVKALSYLIFAELDNNAIQLPDALIPVPMHISKLRQRGYNQSLLLTQALSKLLNIPYHKDFVIKHKATQSQTQLPLKKRLHNVRNCFSVKQHYPINSVAIIDDVITTGATTSAMSKVLKKNGVKTVHVWGLAHTI